MRRRFGGNDDSKARSPLEVTVECYAGHRGEQTPQRLSLDGRTVQVVEVLDAWLALDRRCFKVRGDDRGCSILRQDVTTGRWERAMVDRAGSIG